MTPAEERYGAIDALVLDVDGVLTDGRVIYSDSGQELQAFHVRDGSGMALWHTAGKRAAAITGRGSAALERRAAELHIAPLVLKATDKGEAFMHVCATMHVAPERVAVMGDDLPDLAMFRLAGLRFAVADACRELRDAADFVTAAKGGRGAVREVVELLLKAQGLWSDLLAG